MLPSYLQTDNLYARNGQRQALRSLLEESAGF